MLLDCGQVCSQNSVLYWPTHDVEGTEALQNHSSCRHMNFVTPTDSVRDANERRAVLGHRADAQRHSCGGKKSLRSRFHA